MKTRIKELRKSLKLTQAAFGERVGLNGSTVAGYETGRYAPGSAVVNNICKEFGVNREWLETGQGPMMAPDDRSPLDTLAEEMGLSPQDKVFLERFLSLPPGLRQAAYEFMVDFSARFVGASPAPVAEAQPPPPEPEGRAPDAIHAALDRQYQEEKNPVAKSGGLPSTG